jgi:hypothetical protein
VGEFPLFSDGVPAQYVPPTSIGAPVPGTANVLTGWVEVIASTPYDTSWLHIRGVSWGAVQEANLDIGIGAAGSEKVLIPDLLFWRSTSIVTTGYMLPIAVPKGSRLSIRWRANTTGARLTFSMGLVGAGFPPSASFSRVRAWGNVTNYGTTVDPGATINTLGAWTEINAFTGIHTRALCIGTGNAGNSTRLAGEFVRVQVGVGASLAEKVVLEIWGFSFANTGEDAPLPATTAVYPVSIPYGSRLAIRISCGINDATDRLLRFMIYGMG